jgi:hypothetical protein
MNKLSRLIATCALVFSLSAVALADGGITQGPGLTAPPPGDGIAQTPGFNGDTTTDNSSLEAIDWTILIDWLAQSVAS